jgi:hypothetical protein
MSQKSGQRSESHEIALSLASGFSQNFLARELRGFFNVKIKLVELGSALSSSLESHATGVKPPKMFPRVSSISVSVFAWPSQRP